MKKKTFYMYLVVFKRVNGRLDLVKMIAPSIKAAKEKFTDYYSGDIAAVFRADQCLTEDFRDDYGY